MVFVSIVFPAYLSLTIKIGQTHYTTTPIQALISNIHNINVPLIADSQ